MGNLNEIVITITGTVTGDIYYSRSYPDDDFNNNGKTEWYETPVYKVLIENKSTKKQWKGLRFMPYWNDPKNLDPRYSTKGWVNSGLSNSISKKAVTYYNPVYGVHNRYSPYGGAIQIKGSFLIHAGPETLTLKDYGWGAAGCVEIIGNFDNFKKDIMDLSNSKKTDVHDAILELVKERKLFVTVEHAVAPDFKKKFWKER